jgi:hypothetical protein
MRSSNIISQVLYFFLFLGFQILIFKNLALFEFAPCFIYIGFILLMPFDTPPLLLITLGFLTGVIVDAFYGTWGINAASSVLVGYIRPYIINVMTPKGGYDKGTEVSVAGLGFNWVMTYSAILIFIHHLTLFILEAWGLKVFFHLIGKTLASTIFTLFVFTLLQYLFQTPRRL